MGGEEGEEGRGGLGDGAREIGLLKRKDNAFRERDFD